MEWAYEQNVGVDWVSGWVIPLRLLWLLEHLRPAKKTKWENQTNVVLSFYFWTKLTQYCTVVPRAPDPIHPRHTSAHRQTLTNMNAPSNICTPQPTWMYPQIFEIHHEDDCPSNICTQQPTWLHPQIIVNRNEKMISSNICKLQQSMPPQVFVREGFK